MTGKMNAGRILNSPTRLQPILEILKRADHPLSAEEIAVQGYDFSRSGKIMLNVSTNIGEMRSEENRRDGFIVSEAHRWVKREPGSDTTSKACRFSVLPSELHPWHDGRPRYWLIQAPGWTPTWIITPEGRIARHGKAVTVQEHRQISDPSDDQGKRCAYDPCRNIIPAERAKQGYMTCSEDCRQKWHARNSQKLMHRIGGTTQGGLF